nr:LETM1 and EF-hand domain-containing protein [Ipomoea batatas]
MKLQVSRAAVVDADMVAESSCSSSSSTSEPRHQTLIGKSMAKLITASQNVLMGTQLLFIDISDAFGLLVKQLKGHLLTKRERKKMKQTLIDIATLVPVTILMLIPISAVGHAAMFAAMKRYTPCLIPSPYSSKRIGVVKQLKRTKKMDIKLRNSIEANSVN